MSSSLSILGASARAAAASAVRAGFRPCAVDLFADVDTQAMAETIRIADYPSDFAKIAVELPDGPWIYTGGLENYPELIDAISAQRPLWGNGGDIVRAVRQPQLWTDVLQRAGISMPRIASDLAEVPRDSTWLAKPLRSSGGIGISVVDEQFQLPNNPTANTYFQQRVPGTPASAVFVAARGKATLLGVTEQLSGTPWTGAPPFLYAGSIGPLDLSDDIITTLARMGDDLAAAFNLQGLFGIDGILHDNRFWPIEINPRYTASIEILERASGANFLQFHAVACRDATLPTTPTFGPDKYGKAILYATHDTAFTQAAERAIALVNESTAWPIVADLPAVGEELPVGSPIVSVFAQGNFRWPVVRLLDQRLSTLRAVLQDRA